MRMVDEGDRHLTCVNTWLDRVGELPPTQLIDAFQEAFDALWARAHRSLGDVTLTAIVDRVLFTASEAFPALGATHVEPGRLLFRNFRSGAVRVSHAEIVDAIRFVLVELLTVLGNLTAEILTPALHSELANVSISKKPRKRDHESAPPHPNANARSTKARKR
jgi:hypothetical protein